MHLRHPDNLDMIANDLHDRFLPVVLRSLAEITRCRLLAPETAGQAPNEVRMFEFETLCNGANAGSNLPRCSSPIINSPFNNNLQKR